MSHLGADRPPRFKLGTIIATEGALALLIDDEISFAILRHRSGDWGEVDAHDRERNEDALTHEGRLVSVYRSRSGERVYVITDADRSRTTILLPSEY